MSGYRLAEGGLRIDRSAPRHFTFAGRHHQGFAGDTLASALMASGVDVVARSFKSHRRRGIVSAGPEEPCALVGIGEGARHDPNAKAPMVPLTDGLVATAQNAWPSLSMDLMAVNGLAGNLFAAGFYYKTFIGGPRGTWTRLFEPIIRRAAGMGTAPTEPDPDRYEHANAHCDVLVVGGGPAGLMAAHAAARAGARVILADERDRVGGALASCTDDVDGMPAHAFAAKLAEELEAAGAAVWQRTTVTGHYDGEWTLLTRVCEAGEEGPVRQRHTRVRPREVIVCAGAIERPAVFPGNDLPGVMLADAARTYAVAYGVAPGRTVVVATHHDGAYEAVRDMARAGVRVRTVLDARKNVPADCKAAAREAGAELISGGAVMAAKGSARVKRVIASTPDGPRALAADTLAVSAGWTPNLTLAAQFGSAPVWDEALLAFRPGALPDHCQAVGAIDGAFALSDCLAAGARAGAAAAEALGLSSITATLPQAAGGFVARAVAPPAPQGESKARGKAYVDLQHDVTAADVALAHREGFTAVEHLKRYTTLGMATDQGKTSNVNGLMLMAELTGRPVADVGTTRFRPPATPVAIGALAGAERGADLRPVRRSPMQDWHEANGAEFVAAGAWLRPRAYLQDGETLREATIRETRAVRERVGLCDVSPLGKIEVAGPDSATFLNRLYINAFAKLPVGKARYGIMLRDDGFVMDDGTTWRLSPTRFLVTTTTANAAKVLAHMEVLRDTAWPDLRVSLTSVTDRWAGMALAGPESLTVLQRVSEGADISPEGLPFMGVRHAQIAGVGGMIARLTFSGERAYEIFVPARHGHAVWQALLEAGAPEGIAPYGLEALGTMRIEKGHVAGPELDGRTTAHDLGLARMASTKKAFVGRTMMHRPALTDPDRLSLVGLRSADGQPVRAGAHLVTADGSRSEGPSEGESEGHVTSAAYSPELDCEIALALVKGGASRHGEAMTATDPVRGGNVPVTLVPPVFIDPENARATR